MPSQIKRSFSRLTEADKWTQVSDIPENRQAFLRGTMVNYASDPARFDLAILSEAEDPTYTVIFDKDQTDWHKPTMFNVTPGVETQPEFGALPATITFDTTEDGYAVALFDGFEETFFLRKPLEIRPGTVQFFKVSGWFKLERASSLGALTERLAFIIWPMTEDNEFSTTTGEREYHVASIAHAPDGDGRCYYEVKFTTSLTPVAGFMQLSSITDIDMASLKKILLTGQMNHNDGDGKTAVSEILIEEFTPEHIAAEDPRGARAYHLDNTRSATATNIEQYTEVGIGSEVAILLEAGDQIYVKSDKDDTRVNTFATLETPSAGGLS